MRAIIVIVFVTGLFAGGAFAQAPDEAGNRAHGLDYQPTPREIVPREKAQGVMPSGNQEKANNRQLEHIDKRLMKDEGLGTNSVPKLNTGH